MLRIRLSRTGAKKQPSYRVVVADADAKRDGRVVERIGYYNPRVEPVDYRIDEERALYWLSVGAQPTDAVRRLLVKQGTLDRLARLRQGETREVLVGEFQGIPFDQPAQAMPTFVETEQMVVDELALEVERSAAIDEEE